MKIRKETITPKRAEELLGFNTNNRPLSQAHVSYLAREMRSGRWRQNGDTIKLNGNVLLDGQHRLCAIVESNRPQEAHPGIITAMETCPSIPNQLVAQSLAVAMFYLFSKSDAELAVQFMEEVAHGLGLKEGDPALALRARLIQFGMERKRAQINRVHVMALFIKAWNARLLGNSLRALAYRAGGDTPEEWPTVK